MTRDGTRETYDVRMPRIPRSIRPPVLAALAMACAWLAIPAAGQATTSCDLRKDGRKLGTTYVTSLKVEGISCTGGKKVVRAYHACRRASGGVKGRCTRRVLGFRCSERRNGIPTQFSARVTCRDGGRAVRFAYTQFT
jgi:hypothetical protein